MWWQPMARHTIRNLKIECLVPKLNIQVYGRGGSRRAGEQAAAKLALEAVQVAQKNPVAKPYPTARRAIKTGYCHQSG